MAQDVSILGRKIFFLNPQFILKTKVLRSLVDNEYEVYSFNNPRKVRGLLKLYPYSMLYINVDEGYPLSRWLEYIAWLEKDGELKGVCIGVCSGVLTPNEKERILSRNKIEAGLIDLTSKAVDPLVAILNILVQTQAKGKRKFVRCNSVGGSEDNHAVIHYEGKGYKLDLIDISIAGVSLEILPRDKDAFPERAILRSLFITLGGTDFTHPAVVFGVKKLGDRYVLVLLFLPGLSENVKSQIHRYILEANSTSLKTILDDITEENPFDIKRPTKATGDDSSK